MENFFDVATPEEIQELWGDEEDDETYTPEEIAQLKKMNNDDPDKNCEDLIYLYLLRKDELKALYCLNQIQDPDRKFWAGHAFAPEGIIWD